MRKVRFAQSGTMPILVGCLALTALLTSAATAQAQSEELDFGGIILVVDDADVSADVDESMPAEVDAAAAASESNIPRAEDVVFTDDETGIGRAVTIEDWVVFRD